MSEEVNQPVANTDPVKMRCGWCGGRQSFDGYWLRCDSCGVSSHDPRVKDGLWWRLRAWAGR